MAQQIKRRIECRSQRPLSIRRFRNHRSMHKRQRVNLSHIARMHRRRNVLSRQSVKLRHKARVHRHRNMLSRLNVKLRRKARVHRHSMHRRQSALHNRSARWRNNVRRSSVLPKDVSTTTTSNNKRLV